MGQGYKDAPWVFKGNALYQLNLVRCFHLLTATIAPFTDMHARVPVVCALCTLAETVQLRDGSAHAQAACVIDAG